MARQKLMKQRADEKARRQEEINEKTAELKRIGVRIFKGLGESRAYHFMSKSTGRFKMNDGKKTFLKKWGVSSSWFVKEVLKQGQFYTGPLSENKISPNLKDRLKGLIS